MNRIRIEHIDILEGLPNSPSACAVARALHRQGYLSALCYPGYITWPTGDLAWAAMDLPEEVTEWLMRYDAGDPVEPFVLEVA